MNTSYKINDNKAVIKINKNVYPLSSVKKAIFNYLNDFYITIKEKRNRIELLIETKKEDELIDDNTIKDLLNDCNRESLRYEISVETKDIRELILGRALYSSCIKSDNSNEIINDTKKEYYEEDEDYDINDIAINWFNRRKED
ncbi:MAG: His-Xaa-Ser system protein HxsD [Clostridia bacterium]|nr:His-Xaa-Ser system protein HxsD [Bacilli bacterium]MBR3511472.1 His-Xaa-Ser system protein HxsD [Clostridia bacterium]